MRRDVQRRPSRHVRLVQQRAVLDELLPEPLETAITRHFGLETEANHSEIDLFASKMLKNLGDLEETVSITKASELPTPRPKSRRGRRRGGPWCRWGH